MALKRTLVFAAAVILAAGAAGSNAADKKQSKAPEPQQQGWNDAQMQQPATESIDLNRITRFAKRACSTRM